MSFIAFLLTFSCNQTTQVRNTENNRSTLGQTITDNINQMITISDWGTQEVSNQ